MSKYTTIEHYVNHVMHEITKCDVEQVSENLRALGWEEVVKCSDCKFFKEEPPEKAGFCMYWVDRVIFNDSIGFCAWGERREKAEHENV